MAHKYRPGPYTPLDNLLYAIWWEPISHRLPLWLAPNALTLCGALAAVAAAVLLWVCSPYFQEPGPPAWAELTAAWLIVFYQTCDAEDGLQARRTGASSPLGELLDHGCDCVCLSACTLGYCASLQFGFGLPTFAALCVSWLPYYLAQWESYTTGVTRTGGSLFGITEIELVVAGIHVISGVFGPEVWRMRLHLLGLLSDGIEFRYFCTGVQVVSAMVLAALNVRNVLAMASTPRTKAAALWRATPLMFLVVFTILWPTTLPEQGPRLMCLSVCALFTRITAEAVLCHITLEAYPSWQPALAALPVVYACGLLGLLESWPGKTLIAAYTAFCVWEACSYVADVVNEVATHLDVQLLRLGRRDC